MPITFRCPDCGKKLRASDSNAGKSATCPQCQTRVQIPAPGQEAGSAPAESEAEAGVLSGAGRLLSNVRAWFGNLPANVRRAVRGRAPVGSSAEQFAAEFGEESGRPLPEESAGELGEESPLGHLDLQLHSTRITPRSLGVRALVGALCLLALGTLFWYGRELYRELAGAADPVGYLRGFLQGEHTRHEMWAFGRDAAMLLFGLVLLRGVPSAFRLQPKGRGRLRMALAFLILLAAADLAALWIPQAGIPSGRELRVFRYWQAGIYGGFGLLGLVLLGLSRDLFGGRAADEEPNVIDLVDRILSEAVRVRASDVHVEPTPGQAVLRYRIDGVLHTVARYPMSVLDRLVARIKVMAGMDIAEKRLPQDGGAKAQVAGRSIDLRISTVPSEYGERAVVRILDPETGLLSLNALGLNDRLVRKMDEVVGSPNGVFFCTGPTGSGKTTTLYAALMRANRRERNVITVEDPVEYHLSGITQLPVGQRKGMDFASGLRSILRQDPDVIMVGEVRDSETAHMVVEAAQTGHLVLSTLHTNDSAGAVARLLDLQVEPFVLASSLTAVLAQRLVRRVCSNCSRPYKPGRDEVGELGLEPDGDYTFQRAVGCPKCMQTGYRGRVGLFELLVVDDRIRELITERKDASVVRRHAVESGMSDLRSDGAAKVRAGITTLEEVRRVIESDMEY
ncbi:MAG: ATPase, T2SS/T4P/T4SS family [Planctomycetota bacterium]